MKVSEQGVSDASSVFFHVASPRALRMFFYPVCTGHFFCDETYFLDRTNYGNFLLLYVVRGSGVVEVGGEKYILGQGSLAYIDCYQPHRYYTAQGWEILWLHFDGPLAREYFSEITAVHPAVFPTDAEMVVLKNMERIFDTFSNRKKVVDEAVLSNLINSILTALFVSGPTANDAVGKPKPLKDTLFFISEHINDPLSIDMLAARVFLSKYHFIRLFKKEFGYTPHEYILMNRINASKLALKSTSKSIKEIGLSYGFTSESSFCTTFKRLVGVTPRAYRQGGGTLETEHS